eukprot:CAMPEP_0172483840 /NCGR_PEP_ID=MMETSP1066-20121228/11025_1 /TAXON_ID=671091 /ORGANISM="Coscinodiscus wailesii, Strain CCMP2513" /LENGTH=257 /DNA_ID=CAMNT_0013247979 /DNA_START=84 /DNA_END=854 /DNA_ORIENTATION=-
MAKKYRETTIPGQVEDDLSGCVELVPAMDDGNENGSEDREVLIDNLYEKEREMAKVRHWEEHPYSVGLVETTWSDELTRHQQKKCCDDICMSEMEPTCGCLYLSGLVCPLLGAKRVGNMAVLKESVENTMEDSDDEEQGRRRVSRKKISIVVGPYWPMLVCITYPLILGVSLATAIKGIPGRHPLVIAFWCLCTASLCMALFGVGCRDPGILPRRREAHSDPTWRWNERARTYLPRRAVYDPDCAVVIEEFDHTCPW